MNGGGLPQGSGTTCANVTCPQPTAACCTPDGGCQDFTPAECTNAGGMTHPVGTACATSQCPICPDPYADADLDGDVDSNDFAFYQRCFGLVPLPMACLCYDRDRDGDVDMMDTQPFRDCSTRESVPANVCCDGGPGCP
jgi:hypothetical protein